ncbi:ubiquitin carboxyl-terminal hydrolase 47-like isoform X6 [Saccostrea echinata]|uniref:ubiquitin carboxyl-terminal hydrolase 47-like isoform X6 n=1 Tax=Saccostrea echinata TaxID=191078 RepID=UPI002A7ED2BF|nr:ubiquitin carboxyl-terminal hydrolase 47-like isoform X6 [Saccostrea echinata]
MVTGENTQMVPTENVCVADEEKILCIVRDMIDTQCHGVRHNINLPASTTVRDLISQVAQQFGYVEDTIGVTYEKQIGAEIHEVNLNENEGRKLCDICLTGMRKHNFTITEKEGTLPQKTESGTSAGTSSSTSGISGASGTSSSYYNGASTSTSTDTCLAYPESYSYATAVIKSDTGYVGLVNQAMTCYLNSLLQTLYMTPEFRNAVYRWEFDGREEDMAKSIPYQLQKLFLLLQTSKKKAIETTDLTKSFGWDSSEVWQQHDVQELCRVMFDALEMKWKKTDQANLINNLYQGKLKDYVKCLECGNESARLDTYLDIPLVIRPFGSNETHGSVDEALQAFVEPETLDGNNQYFCEKCNKKCDAHKGLKFVSFPYMLTLQLKRFDFDYSTLHRIKLNDKMSFPGVLNLNHLIEPEHSGSEESTTSHTLEESSDEGIDEGIEIESSTTGPSSENSSLSSEAAANDKNAKTAGAKGPYVYELFSIMVHSGSAAGGHYYAYIKSFKDGLWYSFNDQHVAKITYDDITKTYGGSSTSRGYYSAAYTSSTNAYMLMYRQIDKQRNKDFIQPENFPEHLKKALQKLKDREEQEIRQRELDKSTCKIKVYYFHPREKRKMEQKLEVHKDKTLKEATEICSKLFCVDKSISLDCCRLVKFDEYQDTLECSFEDEDDTPMGLLLGGVKQAYNFDLLLETKRPEQVFQEYRPGGVTVKLYVADLQNDIIQEPPISVRAYHAQTVAEFKHMVAEVLNVSAAQMRCVLERFHNDLKFLSVPNKTLKTEGFFKSNKVYVEYSGEEDTTHFTHTHFFRLLDRHQNTIRIHVNLPSKSDVEDFLKSNSRHEQLLKNAITSVKSREDSSTSLEIRSKNGSDSLDEGISDRGSDSEIDFKLKKTTLSKSDPSIYHSCQSIDNGRVSPLGSASEGRASSPIGHSSSSQDTSTSAEFSIPTSYRGLCNISDGQDEAADSVLGDLNSREPVEHGESDSEQTAPPSPGERVINDTDFKSEENWDSDCDNDVTITKEEASKRYFHIVHNELDLLTKQRNLTVLVDKRITLGAFKKELEPHVGTSSDNFKVYRVYSNNQEFESIRLTETLSFFEDGKLNIKLGRALKPGEYRVKIYQLLLNDAEPGKFLIDTIFAKGMSVLESKKLIIPEIKEQCGIDIPLERCRLRKKTWRNPGTVYVDNQIYEDEVHIFANWEVFLQILDGPEEMNTTSQLAIFVRRWRPSTYELDPFQEVILSSQTVDDLKEKISEISGIPVEDIEYAKGRGTFPCDISLLEIHSDLDWSPHVTSLNSWPLYICDDGCVLYYRDKTEKLAELSESRKKELQEKENARMARGTVRSSCSPRKESSQNLHR